MSTRRHAFPASAAITCTDDTVVFENSLATASDSQLTDFSAPIAGTTAGSSTNVAVNRLTFFSQMFAKKPGSVPPERSWKRAQEPVDLLM